MNTEPFYVRNLSAHKHWHLAGILRPTQHWHRNCRFSFRLSLSAAEPMNTQKLMCFWSEQELAVWIRKGLTGSQYWCCTFRSTTASSFMLDCGFLEQRFMAFFYRSCIFLARLGHEHLIDFYCCCISSRASSVILSRIFHCRLRRVSRYNSYLPLTTEDKAGGVYFPHSW